ncbi:MAG: amino acid ABC transporter permease [Lachnospiraceae bacterium]|nr:amino acid ABC transporter permease [Lachnospiraceae bacterium]
MEIKEKFIATFVKENRYDFFIKGLSNTLIISICAALLGILIGFLIAIIRTTHDNNKKKNVFLDVLNIFAKVYLTVIRGTPATVQLLIMYYIIMSNSTNKILIAIMTFGINSGAYVAEIVRSGIQSIDKGQFEAGRSLGLSYAKTMWFIIVPQAFKNVLPALANEFITLLKETSISGYIALNDLTRAGDIIRSLTYETYFPLFTVAENYLLMVMVLTNLVGKLERRLKKNER